MLELGALFFALTTASLLLFCIRFVRLRVWWAFAATGVVIAVMVVLLTPALECRPVAPWLSPGGLVFYYITGLGFGATALSAACLVAASLLTVWSWRRGGSVIGGSDVT